MEFGIGFFYYHGPQFVCVFASRKNRRRLAGHAPYPARDSIIDDDFDPLPLFIELAHIETVLRSALLHAK